MPEVERQGCATCRSVFIVFDERDKEFCPRCERDQALDRIAILTKALEAYACKENWEASNPDIPDLEDDVDRFMPNTIGWWEARKALNLGDMQT